MRRSLRNPIITRKDVGDVTSVFNPGAVRFEGDVLLMLRVQNRGRETCFLVARSEDGIRFAVDPEPVRFQGLERLEQKVHHCYDARITRLEERYYILFAMDMEDACRLGLSRTDDFRSFEFLGVVSDEDNRNGVLFPERIEGRYLRLDRPNLSRLASGTSTGDTICLSESEDLIRWKVKSPLIRGRFHYWDELIGAGPPPVKTREGWLQIYHGVAMHLSASHVYQAGVLLLDLEDPSRVLARSRYNVLEPRELYELTGQVPNVVFPSGAVPREVDAEGFASLDSRLFVYYGAADTCVCLASASVGELIEAARAG